MTQDEAKADQLNLEAVNGDAEAFLRYLKSGDEVLLRECRARFGWPCPVWKAD